MNCADPFGSEVSRMSGGFSGPGTTQPLDFFAWADGVLAKVATCIPPGRGVALCAGAKTALLAYTTDGPLQIDTNPAENAMQVSLSVGQTECSTGPTVAASAPPSCAHRWKPAR
jgi:hypothetical protein